jgi:lipid-binding SYLF domain-containing protein
MKAMSVGLVVICIVASALAVERTALDRRIRKLTVKFEQMQQKGDKRIPAAILREAQGIILLDRTKAGFIFAFQGGAGVAMLKDPKSGQWGPVGFVSANEASLGLQIGGQQSFLVILLMTTNAARLLTQPSFEFGGEARGTVCNTSAGEEGVVTSRERAMLVYDDRTGLYGGVAIKGGDLSPDSQANSAYYGRALTMQDILYDQKLQRTESASELARALTETIPTVASTPPLTARTNVAVEQLQLLLSDLNAHKQTTALKHLNRYLSEMLTTEHTADADMTVAILERLRGRQTAEAIELLEVQLEGAMTGLEASLSARPKAERQPNSLKILDRAKDYRSRFPRKTGRPNADNG